MNMNYNSQYIPFWDKPMYTVVKDLVLQLILFILIILTLIYLLPSRPLY